MTYDPVTMATAIDEATILNSSTVYATVEVNGTHTRGMMVVDWDSKLKKAPNIRVVRKLDEEIMGKYFYKIVE